MWRFARTDSEPLAGIGDGPFEDADFEALVTKYEAQFDEGQRGAVKRGGLYAHTRGPVPKPDAPVEEAAPVEGEAASREA